MKFSELSSNKVHIIGINGIGMSALAIYLKNNIDVTGSDITYNSSTVNLENIKFKFLLVIKFQISKIEILYFILQLSKTIPKLKKLKETKYLVITDQSSYSLFAKINYHCCYRLSWENIKHLNFRSFISSRRSKPNNHLRWMENFRQNIYLTNSKYVVVEADESDGTVKLNPKYLLFLNVDREHINFYKSYSNFKNKVKKYILSQINKDTKIFINNDDLFLSSLKIL